MRRAHTVLTVILGLALIVSVILGRKTQRDLQQELHTVTDANAVLRETLGNLTVAITDKDKQIDRLLRSCDRPEKTRPSSPLPHPVAARRSRTNSCHPAGNSRHPVW